MRRFLSRSERATLSCMSPSRPTPTGRKFLTAEWRWLAMLNYAVEPILLEPLVPKSTLLDLHEGQAYVSMVGFMFQKTRLLSLPIPWHRDFEEVNLRFYVRREIEGEVRRGVCFIKELVPRWAIATVARAAYNEPYVALPMRHAIVEGSSRLPGGSSPSAQYEWKHAGRWNGLSLRATGEAQPLVSGSHEEFITEHYWGYTAQRDGSSIEYRVEHPSWSVWQAETAELDCNVASLYGAQFAEPLSRPPDTAFLADGSAVAVYRPVRI